MADGKKVRPVRVNIGLTDGQWTQVEGRNVKEGLAVIVGEAALEVTVGGEARSPFTPQIGRGGRPAGAQGGPSASPPAGPAGMGR